MEFSSHWVSKWAIPNPFVSILYDGLRSWSVTLADFAFRQDTKNVSETALIVNVEKLRSTIVVGLDRLTFRTTNPDWESAPELVKLFDGVLELLQSYLNTSIKTQECTVGFHVWPGAEDLTSRTARLVNRALFGEAESYGLVKHDQRTSVLLERSAKYERGVFFRLTRRFESVATFADVALAMYGDEVSALSLIGVEDLIR
jgi:hypothetical protein